MSGIANLGKLGFNWRGDWQENPAPPYTRLDVVRHNNSLWTANVDLKENMEPAVGSVWGLGIEGPKAYTTGIGVEIAIPGRKHISADGVERQVYCKYIDCGTPTPGNGKQVPHNIANFKESTCDLGYGISSAGAFINLAAVSGSPVVARTVYFQTYPTYVYIGCGADVSPTEFSKIIVQLNYTCTNR